jgi:hypothetical protein
MTASGQSLIGASGNEGCSLAAPRQGGVLVNSAVFRSSVLALALLGIAGAAAAHHPPRFERCQRLTFTGEVERIDWTNPHVQLFIQTADGVSHQLGWLDLQALHRAGIQEDTLHVGDHVVVEGGVRTKDVLNKPVLLSSIRRPSDGWEWSEPLQGC